MSKAKHTSRETWLQEAAEIMAPWFKEHGAKMPKKYYVTCGWNKGSSDKGIGQCFSPECCEEGVPHMSVSPCQGDPMRVLDILLHEMVHAAVGIECGHKGEFKRVAQAFGLEGKMTATFVTPGTDLYKRLEEVNKQLGPYPHSALRAPAKKKGKGGSGWLRMVSETDETYKVVISPKTLEEHGAPLDPWGVEMVLVEKDDE